MPVTEMSERDAQSDARCGPGRHTRAGRYVNEERAIDERVTTMEQTEVFVAERPRLVGLAARILGDSSEAEDVVQQAWLRLHGTDATIANLPAWLTTVTVRLCLDRLRQRVPILVAEVTLTQTTSDPAHEVELADTVGVVARRSGPPDPQ